MADVTITEFTTPEFLDNYDTDDVYETMRNILPEDIDSSEGSHTWNFLMPTALTISELCEFILPQVIQLIFPEWSYGEFLDAHAQTRGMTRKAAIAATGQVTFTGAAETVIPAGTMVSTASLNSEDPAITYETTEEATIPESGTVTVDIQCTDAGSEGNTPANTIIFLSSDVSEITAVTNEAAISGGIDEETDEELIERIMEYDQTQGDSFVGNVADYKRWAMSVTGIGNASVIPANDSTGTVTIVLTDLNGDPASETLCTNVYDYIMSPDDPNERLAPINAVLVCTSPATVEISVKATVELTAEAVLEDVTAAFLASLVAYIPQMQEDGEVKISKVGALLSAVEGVNDFADLQIAKQSGSTFSYGTDNIAIGSEELPTVIASDIVLTEGTVG